MARYDPDIGEALLANDLGADGQRLKQCVDCPVATMVSPVAVSSTATGWIFRMHGGQPRVDSVIPHDTEAARSHVLDRFRVATVLTDEQNVGHRQVRLEKSRKPSRSGVRVRVPEKVHFPLLDGF